MTDSEKIEALKELVTARYSASNNGQGYWETGNFDDTFEMGEDSGYSDALMDVARILGVDLPDKEEVTL